MEVMAVDSSTAARAVGNSLVKVITASAMVVSLFFANSALLALLMFMGVRAGDEALDTGTSMLIIEAAVVVLAVAEIAALIRYRSRFFSEGWRITWLLMLTMTVLWFLAAWSFLTVDSVMD